MCHCVFYKHQLFTDALFSSLDIANSNINDTYLSKMKADKIPDVVLVKKFYTDSNRRMKKRKWKLQHLNDQLADDKRGDYNDFLEDLEEDQAFRANVNIYKG